MEEAQFKDFRQGMRRTLVVASMWEGVEKKKKKKNLEMEETNI